MILGGLRDKDYKFRCIYVPTRLDILPVTQHYESLNGILKFYVKVHAIVWLGACPKPRVVRILS